MKNLKKKLRRQQRQLGVVEETVDSQSSVSTSEARDEKPAAGTKRPLEEEDGVLREKKKKKRNGEQAEQLTNQTLPTLDERLNESNEEAQHNLCEDLPKKKKRKKRARQADESVEELQEVQNSSQAVDGSSDSQCALPEGDDTRPLAEPAALSKKSKKKKKKATQHHQSNIGDKEVSSIGIPVEEVEENGTVVSRGKQNNRAGGANMESNQNKTTNELNETGSVCLKKKKKKNKKGQEKHSVSLQTLKKKKEEPNKTQREVFSEGLSDARLAAYGTNPKKLRNKIKYGKRDF